MNNDAISSLLRRTMLDRRRVLRWGGLAAGAVTLRTAPAIARAEDSRADGDESMTPLLMAPTRQSVVLANGITLEYVEQGDPGGIPVVMLHGYADSWYSFSRVLPYLPNSLHVVALTQRGHGDSSHPAAGYRFDDFAADLAGVMDTLGLEPAVIVGHSMGSVVAQRFALNQPERTRGLVLIGSVTTWRGNPVAAEVWEAVADLTDPIDPAFVREFQESTLARPVSPEFLDTVVAESLKVPALVWREAWRTIHETAPPAKLAMLVTPTLITWGDQDGLSPRREQDALLAAIAGSRLVIYPGNGHALHWEEPERFAAELAAFVAGLAG